ncbi:MAG: NhaP-type Na+/H+ or K+/H+ antiporter [Gammaproteobacteria bacterium]|jgi:NhaP-type Na+/H+ or K+/H+ antiporter
MFTIVTLVVGLVIGFVLGWLVRDAQSRPLIAPGEKFGIGVPSRIDEASR